VKRIRIGGGAGYSGDRIEPAVELAEKGQLDYLIFECLAERTIAIAQQAKLGNPASGFDPLLNERMRAVLPFCRQKGIRIVTNMGAANPQAAGGEVCKLARELGLTLRVAVISGDDVLSVIRSNATSFDWCEGSVRPPAADIISANAYVGARPIAQALSMGADVVITGRVSDPALTLGPLMHEFDRSDSDWPRLAQGTLAGHLLECAGQITGGYFADAASCDIPDLHRLGFPIGEFSEDGSVVITKVAGSGGRVSKATCSEQLLYELHDPACYLTPDVTADFSKVTISEVGPDRVLVNGACGTQRPDKLKVTVGYRDGYIGEGQISYAGPGALARARLAGEIVAKRLKLCGVEHGELRCDYIGVNSVSGWIPAENCDPAEVRLRVAARTSSLDAATRIGNEVETLYTCGPAGGGGVTKSAREVIATTAAMIDRDAVRPAIEMQEA
jgi:hypothetical protein